LNLAENDKQRTAKLLPQSALPHKKSISRPSIIIRCLQCDEVTTSLASWRKEAVTIQLKKNEGALVGGATTLAPGLVGHSHLVVIDDGGAAQIYDRPASPRHRRNRDHRV
jgi:hypothetical protein